MTAEEAGAEVWGWRGSGQVVFKGWVGTVMSGARLNGVSVLTTCCEHDEDHRPSSIRSSDFPEEAGTSFLYESSCV